MLVGPIVALWALYLYWLFAPDSHAVLALLPARYWALAPPALLVYAVCAYGATYGAAAAAAAPALDALGALWDAHSAAPSAGGGAALAPAAGDLPLTLVNRAMLAGRR